MHSAETTIESIDVEIFEVASDNRSDGLYKSAPKNNVNTMALLSIRTVDGVIGRAVGQATLFSEKVLDAIIRPVLVGHSAHSREKFLSQFHRLQRAGGGIPLNERLLCRIDSALWDIAAQYARVPLWRLLGGAREHVPAYASIMTLGDGNLSSINDCVNYVQDLVKQGYSVIKLHTFQRNHESFGDWRAEAELASRVREAVGPEIGLMLDGYHWFTRTEAYQLGRRLQELDFIWFEEPLNEFSIESYRWLTSKLDIPVIGPETIPGKFMTRASWAASGAVDILRTGVLNGGGITSCLKTMYLAEAFGMNCEIHGSGHENLALVASSYTSRWYERGLLHPDISYESPLPFLTQIPDPLSGPGQVQASSTADSGLHINLDFVATQTVAKL